MGVVRPKRNLRNSYVVQRAHKIRLNPTPEQVQWLLKAYGVARFCYNWGLEKWREQYEAGENPSAYKLKKQLNAAKDQEFPWMYDVTKCAVDTGFLTLLSRTSSVAARMVMPRRVILALSPSGDLASLSGWTGHESR